MPHHAVEAGVDYVLPPAGIAEELVRIATTHQPAPRTRRVAGGNAPAAAGRAEPAGAPPAVAGDREQELAELFRLLLQEAGVDFSRYKRPTLLRRIDRRMQAVRLQSLGEYVAHLRGDPMELQRLFGDLLIGVTEFFRDADTFEYLKTKVFPQLTAGQSKREPVRIWVVGVSTGQEAYSVAMTLVESVRDESELRAQVFATDISEDNLAFARHGLYPATISAEVSPERLRRFFERADGGYRVKKSIRELCVFARHNVVSDPPFSRLDFISCRNLMIYFDPVLPDKAIRLFHYALSPGGLLLLGHSESLSRHASRFELVDRVHHLYAKKGESSGADTFSLSGPPSRASRPTGFAGATLSLDSFDVGREAERVMAAAYAPASVVVNDRLEILSFQGQTGPYFEHREGRASFDLLGMTREGLGPRLRTAIEEATRKQVPVEMTNLPVRGADRVVSVGVEVRPFRASDKRQYFIIAFKDEKERAASRRLKAGRPEDAKDEASILRGELELCRSRAEALRQEKEAGIEELRASNEEIQSSNEELQSTNEELQTTKEELESVNEELTTINDQVESRNKELSEAHEFTANLLANIDVPVIMVDLDLHIRRFSGTEPIFALSERDLGRPITDLALRVDVDIPDLTEILHDVIDHLRPFDREVKHVSGKWYSMRVRPYTTADHRIEGAVISFVDIDELKRSIESIAEAKALSEALTEVNWTAATAADSEEILRRALAESSRALGAVFGLLILRSQEAWTVQFGEGKARELEGRSIESDDLPQFEKALTTGSPVISEDLAHDPFPAGKLARSLGAASLLAAPLGVDGEHVGALVFGRAGRWVVSDPTVEFAKRLASSLSLWLSRLRFSEQLHKDRRT